MNIEEIKKQVFKFPTPTESEVENWPFKTKLSISPSVLLGNRLFYRGNCVGVVENVEFTETRMFIWADGRKFTLTDCKIELWNPFYEALELVPLHPSRAGVKFWRDGHLFKEKDYKSLFYKTKEYRDKLVFHYESKFGEGIKHQSQVPEVREKIKSSIKAKYGVEWFLERGTHYSAVTNSMIKKFGCENLFFDENWQANRAFNYSCSSALERNIIAELMSYDIPFVSPEYHDFDNGKKQRCMKINGKIYMIDLFDQELNLLIEIQGDYWHCNPNVYKSDYYHTVKNKTAGEIWQEDRLREQSIVNSSGCTYITIWEQDWVKNKKIIKDFVKNTVYDIIKNKENNKKGL